MTLGRNIVRGGIGLMFHPRHGLWMERGTEETFGVPRPHCAVAMRLLVRDPHARLKGLWNLGFRGDALRGAVLRR